MAPAAKVKTDEKTQGQMETKTRMYQRLKGRDDNKRNAEARQGQTNKGHTQIPLDLETLFQAWIVGDSIRGGC